MVFATHTHTARSKEHQQCTTGAHSATIYRVLQDNELVTASTDGRLCIFKGASFLPWRHCENLGRLTCVTTGDLQNDGKTVVVCVSAEGFCSMFDVVGNSSGGNGKPKTEEDEGTALREPSAPLTATNIQVRSSMHPWAHPWAHTINNPSLPPRL